MKATKMFRPRSARKILESLLDESIRTGEALSVAEVEVDQLSKELCAFRETSPDWRTAFSWTSTGKERDLLESRLRAAVRRRDQCHGSNELAGRFRLLIEQELRRG